MDKIKNQLAGVAALLGVIAAITPSKAATPAN